MWGTRAVTSVGAVASGVRTRILNGNTQKVVMASSLDSDKGTRCDVIQIGDMVVYVKDGARGIVIGLEGEKYHIKWEDDFVSWEEREWLRLETMEKTEQRE